MVGSLVYFAVLSALLLSAGVSDAYSVDSQLSAESEDVLGMGEGSVGDVESAQDHNIHKRSPLDAKHASELRHEIARSAAVKSAAAKERSTLPARKRGSDNIQNSPGSTSFWGSGDPLKPTHKLPRHTLSSNIVYPNPPPVRKSLRQNIMRYKYGDSVITIPYSSSYRDTDSYAPTYTPIEVVPTGCPCPVPYSSLPESFDIMTGCPCPWDPVVISPKSYYKRKSMRHLETNNGNDYRPSIAKNAAELQHRLESLSRANSALARGEDEDYYCDEEDCSETHYHPPDYPAAGANTHYVGGKFPPGQYFPPGYYPPNPFSTIQGFPPIDIDYSGDYITRDDVIWDYPEEYISSEPIYSMGMHIPDGRRGTYKRSRKQ